MPLYIGDTRVSRKNFFGRTSLIALEPAWAILEPLLHDPSRARDAKIVLAKWRGDEQDRRFNTWNLLAAAIQTELTTKRANYFYQQKGENLNVETVIFRSEVPTSSIGWTQPQFFEELGHPCNKRWAYGEDWSSRAMAELMSADFIKYEPVFKELGPGLKRRAEQEFLMQNMVKGALWDAAEVADQFQVGIAVRGTGLSAHMGIESGDPTKAQEFKNKTSKEIDLILCEELEWSQLGSVVHYDPRTEWTSQKAAMYAEHGLTPMFHDVATDFDWQMKKYRIKQRVQLLGPRLKVPAEKDLKDAFFSRSKEYMEEDHEYRKGHYAPYTTLVGPYVRLKVRPDANMVGDHDLFAFTMPEPEKYGIFMQEKDARVGQAQKALQNKQTFQAQHGGIWYWRPSKSFNLGIKNKIMGAHGPEGDEPLVYIRPGKQVTAAYYTKEDRLKSVWDNPAWTKWMKKTHSGRMLLSGGTEKE